MRDPFLHNLKIVGIFFSALGLGIVFLMFRWQVVEHDKWETLATSQYSEEQRSTQSRGVIYASDGTVLAIDEPAWGVYASLSGDETERSEFFANKDKYVADVAGILGVEKTSIEKVLTDNFMYVKLASGVSNEQKAALESVKISDMFSAGFGLYFEKEEKRIYPNGRLASHVLGFMGKNSLGEDIGMYGIEGYYFGDMLTQSGYTYEEKDALGNVILTAEYDPVIPRSGKSITLTLVPNIQTKVESILKSKVEEYQAKSGSAIIMDPKTGAIIAMANYPDYDPNNYWKVSDSWIYRNKAVADVYEFGSVEKPVTMSIGLESGNVPLDWICSDSMGYIQLYDYKIYTWNSLAYGDLSLAQILQKSHNPCIAQVSLMTGFDFYYQKLQEFGYGEFIGIGLEDEATSYLYPYEMWTKLDLAVTAFGQSISATPLQILSAIGTIANDGQRMKPYIVSEVEDEQETIKYEPQLMATPISATTSEQVTQMMVSVVREGESSWWFNEYVPNYDIAGKTGTAQIPKPNEVGYYDDKTNTTFIGFAPTDDPKMVMIVRIEEPKTSTFAAYTAVPAWIDIFKAVADDLEIYPN